MTDNLIDDKLCLLEAARMLISDPECWTTQTGARDRSGRTVAPSNPKAVSWCALGAVLAFQDEIGFSYVNHWYALDVELQRIAVSMHKNGVALLNDEYGHTQVLAMFDRAIEQRIGRDL